MGEPKKDSPASTPHLDFTAALLTLGLQELVSFDHNTFALRLAFSLLNCNLSETHIHPSLDVNVVTYTGVNHSQRRPPSESLVMMGSQKFALTNLVTICSEIYLLLMIGLRMHVLVRPL